MSQSGSSTVHHEDGPEDPAGGANEAGSFQRLSPYHLWSALPDGQGHLGRPDPKARAPSPASGPDEAARVNSSLILMTIATISRRATMYGLKCSLSSRPAWELCWYRLRKFGPLLKSTLLSM